MSDYRSYDDRGDRGDPPRRYKSTRTRPREDDDSQYVEESTYVERGKGRAPRDLAYRGSRDRDDSVEDIPRDFPPPRSRRPRGYDDYDDPPRRTRSAAGDTRDRYARDRYSDDYDSYGASAAGAGAGAAYGASRSRRGGDRRDSRRDRGDRDGYYSDESPPPRDRKKSGIEGTLESLGLGGGIGGIVGALMNGGKDKDKDRDRSRSRSRGGGGRDRGGSYDDRDRDRGSSRGKPSRDVKNRQWAQAAQAALVAGAIEAFKSRNQPGSWTGEKGKRIATAAFGAGGIDKLVDKDPDKKSHRHLFEAVVGGLAANRLANGPARSASQDRRGRSPSGSPGRSRSRSRSILDRFRSKSRGGSADGSDRGRSNGAGGSSKHDTLKDLAAGGALAAAGKKIYDSVRTRSRRRRSPSAGSEDSYEPPSRNRRRERDVGQNNPRSRSMPPDDRAVVGPQRHNAGALAAGGGAALIGSKGHNGKDDLESSDSESTTDMENQRKRMRGKEFLTAGLASVATIHAAHAVYQSMEASQRRHKLVEDGEMTVEEARKKKSKAWLQDAAAVGIAALGIKGAYSEWKEMNEQRHSVKELEEKRRNRRKRREKRMREQAKMNGGGPSGAYMSGGAGPPPDRYGPPSLPPPPMGYDRR